ncbi:zonular occludens toxin domain-containing protein [Uliginosibacterium sp. TH139]|uniref:zonular occludens toxin domain-containing protein n=1 Tax=Uliginosibacterium sp. TH139 TaxID=2067453 RepID=UPI000C7CD1F7|nr:zonular occludens toxin domain-containing protein [Uliginosibacterium sp. TH139]PLK46939.1 hypothetical protein C0V76_19305 [Uliginosibacterium sp. TH139]
MIHYLLGTSGSGKSYETVRYHILDAVKSGRKVITNLPLDLQAFALLDPAYPALIERRTKPLPVRGTWEPTREEGAFNVLPESEWRQAPNPRVFANVWDYYDEWRHPQHKYGPLFVIDEAQNVIPFKATSVEVEEWAALHRHWVCDVLYLTQSYGKTSAAIRENVQMVYRFVKKVAWGQPDKYIRKVSSGFRGEVLNTSERSYDPDYFFLYRSHTQGVAGVEAMPNDIKPWWQHWTFIGCAIALLIAVGMFSWVGYRVSHKPPKQAVAAPTRGGVVSAGGAADQELLRQVRAAAASSVSASSAASSSVAPSPRAADFGPYTERGLHLAGGMKMGGRHVMLFAVSQNGFTVTTTTSSELEAAGYTITSLNDCVAELRYQNTVRSVICDVPQQGQGIAGFSNSGAPTRATVTTVSKGI